MSKPEVVRQGNAAIARHQGGPVYKWWIARELGITLPTLRDYLRDYELDWPPPWSPAS